MNFGLTDIWNLSGGSPGPLGPWVRRSVGSSLWACSSVTPTSSTSPIAKPLLLNVPTADILPYARTHDDAVWAGVGRPGPRRGDDWAARQVFFWPPSLAGLGLLAALQGIAFRQLTGQKLSRYCLQC